MKNKSFSMLFISMMLILICNLTHAENLNIAVAANFKQTLEALKQDFEKSSPHTIKIISASTGQLVQQISQHAPFDILLAANTAHPQLLWQHIHESRNLGLDALRIYAKGRLVFYSNITINQSQTITDILNDPRYVRLSVANSTLAPYGLAAVQTLECLKQQQWQSKLVIGQNVAQALQFIDSQSVDGGFVALSQVLNKDQTRIRHVNEECYDDINQMALRLNNKPASLAFMLFLNSDTARNIIERHGYYLPN
ncbi:MAG: molybdate ABC transporter substrate-binding protein [Bermanella sp.]